ncbi:MAG: cytochrome b6 [Chloroflexi bacterium]|nr:MAG: cytochrome b6 [Chloroflexota bacterium]TMF84068.1 MAG: cytochrome b6 [Chloroflexota bacterium]TMG14137.1 MAG: cytochrome b6 [Chloroflexota bacterium]
MDSKLSRSAPRSGRGQGAVVGWLDERFPLVQSVDAELCRRVPNYASAFYRYLGGLALIILFIEFLTGFLLGVYYVPDGAGQPAPAFTSVDYIQHTVYLGWLVRGIHFWGASVLIVVALLHMTFVFWTGGYRAPRELNWMVGVVVFLLILAFSLTGSLLPWDLNAYFARGRELSILSGASVLPGGVSEFLKNLLQGGPIIGPATLLRFYIAHVFLLPAVIAGLMYVHFRLVRRQGPAEPS